MLHGSVQGQSRKENNLVAAMVKKAFMRAIK